MSCQLPPEIENSSLSFKSDTWANISWTIKNESRELVDSYYGIELGYRPQGELQENLFHLSKYDSFAIIRNLHHKTSYVVRLFTANNCGTTTSSEIKFDTHVTAIDPHALNLMTHEILLTFCVILLWLFILRYFFKTYGEVCFVTGLTYGGYSTTKYDANDDSEPALISSRGPTDMYQMDKSTTYDFLHVGEDHTDMYGSKISLLVNPAMKRRCARQGYGNRSPSRTKLGQSKWRSEANLKSSTESLSQSSSLRHTKSDVNLMIHPNPNHIKNKLSAPNGSGIHLIVPRPENIQSEKRRDDYSHNLQSSGGTASFESAVENLQPPPQQQQPQPPIHRKSLTGGYQGTANLQTRRQVSEVLLGKATKDIRRQPKRPSLKQIGKLSRIMGMGRQKSPSPPNVLETSANGNDQDIESEQTTYPRIVVRRPTRRRHMATVLEEDQGLLITPPSLTDRKNKQKVTGTSGQENREDSTESYHTAQESLNRGGDGLSVL